MAASLSFSQSIQSSLILQHYYGKQLQGGTEEQDGQWRISLRKQILLTSIFFGMSCAIEFENMYSVISLQYFGLPVALVTIPGLVSGVTSIFLLPFLGHISDKGSNPKKRKLVVQGVSVIIFLIGLTSLATCSWVKATNQAMSMESIGVVRLNGSHHFSNTTESSLTASGISTTLDPTFSHVPLIAYVALITILFFESGYDLSMTSTRANVLETAPPKQTTAILSMGSAMSALSAVFVAVIGICDFPKILGPLTGKDGYAMTLMLISTIIAFFLIATAYSSIKTSLTLHKARSMNEGEKQPLLAADVDTTSQNGMANSHTSITSSEDFVEGGKKRNGYNTMQENEIYSPFSSSSLTSSLIDFLAPGLPEPKDQRTFVNQKGSVLPTSQSVTRSGVVDRKGDSTQEMPPCLSESDYKPELSQNQLTMTKSPSLRTMKESEFLQRGYDNQNFHLTDDQQRAREISSLSTSTSSQPGEKALGQLHLKNFKDNLERQSNDAAAQENTHSLLRNRRFFVCIIQAFFGFGCVYTVTLFHSNTVTLEVYKGDPQALPGTPGRERYESGVRMGSFGILASCCTFFLFSMLITRLVDRIGALALLMTTNSVTCVATIACICVPGLTTYFCMMLAYGSNKSAVYTLPFVLGTQYVTPHVNDGGASEEGLSKESIGKMTSTLGVALPVTSICMSSLMGPLMEATGNTWVPMYYVVAMTTGSVTAGGIQFFL